MRFRGGGVGHQSTRVATDFFKQDWDNLDAGIESEDTVGDESDEPDEEVLDEEEEEEEYGYIQEYEPNESSDDEPANGGDDEEIHLGPEEDGGAVDSDMEELGYAKY